MMKNYEKPVILVNDDLAEGVYAASGDCYTVTTNIHQAPETGRGDYRIQVDARHDADHNSNYNQQLVITFNMPVDYVSSNGSLLSGNGTTTLTIQFAYWNNHQDNIGMGDLVVTADAGLAVTSVTLLDMAKQY